MASQNDNSRITENHPWVRNFGPTSKRPSTDLIAGQLYNNTTTGNLEAYNGASWVSLTSGAGTSFPGSPATGQTYFRTDRLLEYAYDGTRWLSTEIYTSDISFIFTSAFGVVYPYFLTAGQSAWAKHNIGNISVVLVDMELELNQANVGSSINYYDWVWSAASLTGGVGGEPALDTKTIAANSWTSKKWTAAAASLSSGTIAFGANPAQILFTAHGSPGTLWMSGKIRYREVG